MPNLSIVGCFLWWWLLLFDFGKQSRKKYTFIEIVSIVFCAHTLIHTYSSMCCSSGVLPAFCGSACVMLAQRPYYIHDCKPYIEMAFDCHGSSYGFSNDR